MNMNPGTRFSGAEERNAGRRPSSGSVRATMPSRAAVKNDFVEPTMTLIFDSALQPPPPGVRGMRDRSRQLLYKDEKYCVHLRIDHAERRKGYTLLGQFLSGAPAVEGVEDVPVVLYSTNGLVASAITDPLGEFLFEFERETLMEIAFEMPGRSSVILAIPDLAA